MRDFPHPLSMSTTHRSTPPDRAPARALRLEVREVLARGGLVAMATETVYGIAGRADRPEVLDRLSALKARDPERTFTWHVSSHAPDRKSTRLNSSH